MVPFVSVVALQSEVVTSADNPAGTTANGTVDDGDLVGERHAGRIDGCIGTTVRTDQNHFIIVWQHGVLPCVSNTVFV
jgi:hypothetical protein